MGFQYDDKVTNINNIIAGHLNHLNNLNQSEYIKTNNNNEYKYDDFLIISIGNMKYNITNNIPNNYSNEIFNSIIDINYELFNMKDIIFNYKNNKYIKYTLILPIHNIYNMLMDICNNIIFESKLYSIDNNNNEKWNGLQLNEIEVW